MGDTYSNLNIGHYNREAMISIDNIVDAMSVQTITETIECVNGSDSYCRACTRMYEKRFDVLGVREGDRVVGYVPRSACAMHLSENTLCSIVMRETAAEFRRSTFGPTLKLYDALQELTQRQRLFIRDTESGDVVGIVTRADLQKAPIRMMLFAYMTVFEMHLTAMIRERYPHDGWTTGVVPPIGLTGYEKTDRDEREAAGEDTDLLDCLSFSKKVRIIKRTKDLASALQERNAEIVPDLSKIGDLRNSLAHSSSLANRKRRWADVAALIREIRQVNACVEVLHGSSSMSSQRSEPNA